MTIKTITIYATTIQAITMQAVASAGFQTQRAWAAGNTSECHMLSDAEVRPGRPSRPAHAHMPARTHPRARMHMHVHVQVKAGIAKLQGCKANQ